MIQFRQVSFRYPGAAGPLLQDISLTIAKGETVLITGNSGCGKSTLLRMMNGLIPNVHVGMLSGEIHINGHPLPELTMEQLSRLTGSVFQDPRSQFFTTQVMDELAFSSENLGISESIIEQRMTDVIPQFGLSHLLDRDVFAMSSGERQRTTVAAAHMHEPEIYIMDEPAANLDRESIQHIAESLSVLKKRSKTIVIAEHRFDYLEGIIDRVILMDRGRITDSFDASTWTHLSDDERVASGLRGIFVDATQYKHPLQQVARQAGLSLEAITFQARHQQSVVKVEQLDFAPGEIIGITGPNGSGKSTFFRGLCGLLPQRSGRIRWNGQVVSATERLRLMHLVMQDCDFQLFTASVGEEIRFGLPSGMEREVRASRILSELKLDGMDHVHPATLSGGQKQRLVIAAGWMKNPAVMLLDEPTSGMDGNQMRRLARLIQALAEQGTICMIISHDQPFLSLLCPRMLTFREGKIFENEG